MKERAEFTSRVLRTVLEEHSDKKKGLQNADPVAQAAYVLSIW
jgi:hypothetical protein